MEVPYYERAEEDKPEYRRISKVWMYLVLLLFLPLSWINPGAIMVILSASTSVITIVSIILSIIGEVYLFHPDNVISNKIVNFLNKRV